MELLIMLYELFTLVFLSSFICCKLIIYNAHRLDLLAHPNDRSSHQVPTPHGGGLGIVLGSLLAGVFACYATQQTFNHLQHSAILGLGSIIAIVGFVDDKYHLSAKVRLLFQLLVTMSLMFILGMLPAMPLLSVMGWDIGLSGVLLSAIIALALAWWINLFNFMDGIDGIAGMQALFMLLAAGALMLPHLQQNQSLTVWVLGIIAAVLGFLVLNWSPAKLFMGDVGSTFLAFMIGVVALVTIQLNYLGYMPWLILSLLFVVDATVTLAVRLKRGKKAGEAHRSHAYQRLARQYKSHAKVSLLYLAINMCWLLPCAFMSMWYPQVAAVTLFTAVVPVLCLVLWARAGYDD